MNWTKWHVPLYERYTTLREALVSLHQVGAKPTKIPLIVRLFENPNFNFLNIFPGAVTLEQHDIIHIILGRGLLPRDEAFVLGYTMGETKKSSQTRAKIFSWIASILYPAPYRFGAVERAIFLEGFMAGQQGNTDLQHIDFEPCMDMTVEMLRRYLKVDTQLLLMCYYHEYLYFPLSPESQRLIRA